MIPQNRKKVKSRVRFIHIKNPIFWAFRGRFCPFTVCSRFCFCAALWVECGHLTACQQTQFEQKVKNGGRAFICLRFVQTKCQIVYILSLFNLLSSHSHHAVFADPTRHSSIRSLDGYVYFAQISGQIFYALAICTNFAEPRIFRTIRVFFRPFSPIFSVF